MSLPKLDRSTAFLSCLDKWNLYAGTGRFGVHSLEKACQYDTGIIFVFWPPPGFQDRGNDLIVSSFSSVLPCPIDHENDIIQECDRGEDDELDARECLAKQFADQPRKSCETKQE